MRRSVLFGLVLLSWATVAMAQVTGQPVRVRVAATTFAAQTAAGTTTEANIVGAAQHATELIVTGPPATCTYRLQGSSDAITWFHISASDMTCTSTITAFEANKPAKYVRGNLLTFTETGATFSTNLTGTNNDLTCTAVGSGGDGNLVTVRYVNPGTPGAGLSVTVLANAITVNLATDGSSVITSTGATIKTAYDLVAAAVALATVANKSANDGTGVVIALTATALSGGVDATVTLKHLGY